MTRSIATPGLIVVFTAIFSFGCQSSSKSTSSPMSPGPLTAWAEPIPEAIEVGEQAFPDGFTRSITTLQPFDGRMWIGYGDATKNLGSEIPVVFKWFASADDPTARTADVMATGQGPQQRSPADTGEEQLEPYRIIDGDLWQPGVDSTNEDEAWTQAKAGTWRVVDGERVQTKLIEGNVFKLEPGSETPVWRKYRNIPGGEHVHDIIGFDGAIYAVGSGADYRFEFGNGIVFRYLWRSTDGGNTFETVRRVQVPEVGGFDTRFRRLLAVGDTLYVLGYLNPFRTQGPITGVHLTVRHEDGEPILEDLGGDLGDLLPIRTYVLPGGDQGLIVAREGRRGRTRTFLADEDGYRELEAWAGRRVVDLAIAPGGAEILVVASDGFPEDDEEPQRFAFYRSSCDEIDRLDEIRVIDELNPTAVAIFDGAIFVGSDDGRVFRAAMNP